MAPTDRDDDPTHALDDFVRRMRQPATPPAPAPDLSDLRARLNASAAPAPARPRGGVLRSGQRWDTGDVEDVPIIELPRPQPQDTTIPQVTLPPVDLQAEQMLSALQPEVDLPDVQEAPPPNAETLEDATRGAREFAASQWDLDAQASNAPVWQPDPAALQLRPASHPRVLAHWQPDAWVGAVRLVFDSATEFITTTNGPAVQTFPPHRLLLLWPPQAAHGVVGRWPQQVQLITGAASQAGVAALGLLPDEALLWLMPDTDDLDWVLGADIALHHMPALKPFQLQGLRAFIDAARAASFVRVNDRYYQPAPGAAVVPRQETARG